MGVLFVVPPSECAIFSAVPDNCRQIYKYTDAIKPQPKRRHEGVNE